MMLMGVCKVAPPALEVVPLKVTVLRPLLEAEIVNFEISAFDVSVRR